jgi:hypothetical protein
MGNLVVSPLNAALYIAIAVSVIALFVTVKDWKELPPPVRTLILWGIVLVVLVFIFVLNRVKWI